jgi:lysophospholipase L1-like esterase
LVHFSDIIQIQKMTLKPMTKLVMALCLIYSPASAQTTIRYVALGDSYTIGTGALPNESWPVLMARQLQEKDIPIELIANLGRNGWTTKNLIDDQIPVVRKMQPDFVTVLIGVNDFAQKVELSVFQNNVVVILDELLGIMKDAKKILVITIPDFSVTPVGHEYSNGRDISKGILEFNEIILKQTKVRGLKVVDLYPLSKKMEQDHTLIATDGLHPSAKGYALWAKEIEPIVERLLK